MLVAVSKGMEAVKRCSNKIVEFLTGGGVPANAGCPVCDHKMVVVLRQHFFVLTGMVQKVYLIVLGALKAFKNVKDVHCVLTEMFQCLSFNVILIQNTEKRYRDGQITPLRRTLASCH